VNPFAAAGRPESLVLRFFGSLRLVNPLLLALGAMFLQQTFIALGRALPAVIAPAIITDLRLDAFWIGIEKRARLKFSKFEPRPFDASHLVRCNFGCVEQTASQAQPYVLAFSMAFVPK
jgi:hypothetical protein